MGMCSEGIVAYFVVLLQHLLGGSWSHSLATQVYSRSADCTLMVFGDWLDSIAHKSVTIISKDKIGLGRRSAQLYATRCIY